MIELVASSAAQPVLNLFGDVDPREAAVATSDIVSATIDRIEGLSCHGRGMLKRDE